jgi:hypothetical protein
MKKFEYLGDIIKRAIEENIKVKKEPFYIGEHSIKLATMEKLAFYAIIKFLTTKNPNLKIENFEEFKQFKEAEQLLNGSELQGFSFIKISKYESIKEPTQENNRSIFCTKCILKQSLTQQRAQRQRNTPEIERS